MLHVLFHFLHLDFLDKLTTPEGLIALLSAGLSGWLGYAVLATIVFAETGLLVGFVLPGDSLLFTIGVVAGAGRLNIAAIIILLICACMLGDWSGYLLGRRIGPAVFKRPNSRFFKQEHLQRTHEFYERYGGKTIIFAKFVPIVRTFAPFVAGVGRMRYTKFASFDIFGAIGWVSSITVLGFFLGHNDFVRHNFDKFVLLIIFASLLPVIYHVLKAKFGKTEAVKEGSAA